MAGVGDINDVDPGDSWKPVSMQTLAMTAVLKYGLPKKALVPTWVLELFAPGTDADGRPDQGEVWRTRPKNPTRANLTRWLSDFLGGEEASDLAGRFDTSYPGLLAVG